jgi:HTH-type transcriptional regulator/antitoxin HigA
MTIKPIRDETDYGAALAEIDSLMGVARGTPDADRLEVLVALVETQEAERWSIDAPDRGQVPNAS